MPTAKKPVGDTPDPNAPLEEGPPPATAEDDTVATPKQTGSTTHSSLTARPK